MSYSAAIPVVSALSALAELTANLVRAQSTAEVSLILRKSVKWMLPVDHVTVVLDPSKATPAVARVMETRSAQMFREEAKEVDPALEGMMVMPLTDGESIAALILGVRCEYVLRDLDLGTCHLLAHNVVSALRMIRLLERERAAREAAEVAIRARDQMIQAVTHDLRNPLGVVMALFEMVTVDAPQAIPADDMDSINISLRRMKGLIEELLDISKGQSGQLVLRRTRGDLAAIVREAATSSRVLVRDHHIDIDVPESIVGMFDEPRMARVLGNLMSNALKYSPRGGSVRVHATRIVNTAEIRVTDSGIGIPAADLPFVFDRFRRAKNVGGIDGNGIGLAASRQVVNAHGGSIDVESVEGAGSTFIVRLPLAG